MTVLLVHSDDAHMVKKAKRLGSVMLTSVLSVLGEDCACDNELKYIHVPDRKLQ